MVHPCDPFDCIDYEVDLYGKPIVAPVLERDEIGFYRCDICGNRVLDDEKEESLKICGDILCPHCLVDIICNHRMVETKIVGEKL